MSKNDLSVLTVQIYASNEKLIIILVLCVHLSCDWSLHVSEVYFCVLLPQDGLYALPPQLSLPPTPFADHSPLEMELQQTRMEQLINHRNVISNCCVLDLDQDSLLGEWYL
jgi:hypothetical protein